MANRVVPKNSNIASKVPLAGDLVRYEIALNSADKIIYFKDHNDLIQSIGGGGGSGDMLKSTYDTTDNGIVDNAEKVNGLTVLTAVPINAVFTDTTYSVGNGGLTEINFTSALKTKLDGIEAGANNYSHPTTDGNKHVPANGTTNDGKVLTASATAGVYTWETPASGGGEFPPNSQTFTTSGTFTVPAGVTKLMVIGSGGGGGGGGGFSSGSTSVGAYGGGGGGAALEYYEKTITVTPGENITVTIGAGGAGGLGGEGSAGAVGVAGSAGSNSTFGSYITFSGCKSGRGGGTLGTTAELRGGQGGEPMGGSVFGTGAFGGTFTYGTGGTGGAGGVGRHSNGSAGSNGGSTDSADPNRYDGGTGGTGGSGFIEVYWH